MSTAEKVLLGISISCILYPIIIELYDWGKFFCKLGTVRMLGLKNRFVKDPEEWRKNWNKSMDILEEISPGVGAKRFKL